MNIWSVWRSYACMEILPMVYKGYIWLFLNYYDRLTLHRVIYEIYPVFIRIISFYYWNITEHYYPYCILNLTRILDILYLRIIDNLRCIWRVIPYYYTTFMRIPSPYYWDNTYQYLGTPYPFATYGCQSQHTKQYGVP